MDDLLPWLLDPAARVLSGPEVLAELGERLVAASVPVMRLSSALRTSHPEVQVVSLEWTRSGQRVALERPHGIATSRAYQTSPIAAIAAGAGHLRVDLTAPELPYPVCEELAAAGGTDYLIFTLRGQPDTFLSVVSDAPGGLRDEDVEGLLGLANPLGMLLQILTARHAHESLLRAYLGRATAQRVLDGAFRRGDGEVVDAIVWFSDLRSFTRRTAELELSELLDDLDTYFQVVSDAVQAGGGEVLKLIGDAVLGIFAVGDDPHGAAVAAVRAAATALADLEAAMPHGDPLRMGVALHRGPVMYGNVGSRSRLDYTVIGAPVNEASRVAGLCRELDRSLLLTGPVATLVAGDVDLEDLGAHDLRGAPRPVPVHGVVSAPGRAFPGRP